VKNLFNLTKIGPTPSDGVSFFFWAFLDEHYSSNDEKDLFFTFLIN